MYLPEVFSQSKLELRQKISELLRILHKVQTKTALFVLGFELTTFLSVAHGTELPLAPSPEIISQ